MREIGRLKEVTFRAAGGGTGEEIDVDIFDTSDVCYEQLIVYSPEDKEIIGGYRFIDSFKAIDTVNKNICQLQITMSFQSSLLEDFYHRQLSWEEAGCN